MRNINKLLEAVSIKIQLFILKIILGGGELIMAMFFCQRVVLGKTEFKDVPAKLKDQVKELLIEAGLEDLVVEE
jgi:hypothetical protein